MDRWGSVISLLEKPEDPPTDLALVGVFLFDRSIHDAVRALEPSSRGELEITDAIQWLIDNGHRVQADLLQGWWIDTGKVTPLLDANRLLLETLETRIEGDVDEATTLDGRVVIEAGATVRSSRIRGPVAIAAGTLIEDSFIGPFTAIGERCQVTNSEVEHSVVMSDSRIIDIPRLEDSLIGREAAVIRSQRAAPRAPAGARRSLPGGHRVRLLVTGGAGFIGSNYARLVLGSSDDDVTVFDALTYAGNRENLADLVDHPRFRFVHGDICDRDAVRSAMDGHCAVVHFAAESHVDRSIVGPDAFVRTNCSGTNVLCDVARQVGWVASCTSRPTRSTARSRKALSPRPTPSGRDHPTRPPRPAATSSPSATTPRTASRSS